MGYEIIRNFEHFRLDRQMENKIFYVSWNDKEAKQRKRAPLDTANEEIAHDKAHKLRDSGCTDPRDFLSRAEIITVEDVLNADLERKMALASADTECAAITKILASPIGKKNIAAIRKADYVKLNETWAEEGLKNSTISRYLSTLRSAITEAVNDNGVNPMQVVKVPEFRKQANRDAEDQKGADVTPEEMALIFDNMHPTHGRLAYFFLLNTGGRVGAVLDLTGEQIDLTNGLIHLNPEGRIQNNKFRPVLPLSIVARKWSSILKLPKKGPLIQYRGTQVASIKNAMRGAVRRAGLSKEINSYSIRYAMAAKLRSHGISTEQIALFLGHSRPIRRHRTTMGYAPFEKNYLKNLIPAIDEFISEIDQHSSLGLDTPDKWIENYVERLNDTNGKKPFS